MLPSWMGLLAAPRVASRARSSAVIQSVRQSEPGAKTLASKSVPLGACSSSRTYWGFTSQHDTKIPVSKERTFLKMWYHLTSLGMLSA